MKIWEQVDRTGSNLIYSWLLDAPFRFRLQGWKWIRGMPGSWVTNDAQLAHETAQLHSLQIVTNGTHEVHKAPMHKAA